MGKPNGGGGGGGEENLAYERDTKLDEASKSKYIYMIRVF